jgi:hypothetical protein
LTRPAGEPGPDELVRTYALKAHPEGGSFAETYRAAGRTPTPSGDRPFSTAICFLLRRGEVSRLHRIKSDETWHFYSGGPLTVAEIAPDGRTRETTLGRDLAAGQTFQHVVPAGRWFGAFPAPGAEFSFVGCTVAPGFDFADFELARRGELLALFPGAAGLITRLTEE